MMWRDHRYDLPRVTGDWREDAIGMALLLATIVGVLALSWLLDRVMDLLR